MEWSSSRIVVSGVGYRGKTPGGSNEPPAIATRRPAARGRVFGSCDRGALALPGHGIDAAQRRALRQSAAARLNRRQKKEDQGDQRTETATIGSRTQRRLLGC